MACNENSDFQQAISHALQWLAAPKYGWSKEQVPNVWGKRHFSLVTHLIWQVNLIWSPTIFVFNNKLRINTPCLIGSGDFTIDIIIGGPGSKPETQWSKGYYHYISHRSRKKSYWYSWSAYHPFLRLKNLQHSCWPLTFCLHFAHVQDSVSHPHRSTLYPTERLCLMLIFPG